MSQRLLLLLFLAVFVNCVSCTTFHIITTLSSPCPGEFNGEPCLTLAQYVANPSQSRPNITFQFEPGTHYLPDVLTVTNGQSLTVSSTNVTIVCTTSTAKITITSVENVHISGMTFQWCNNTVISLSRVASALLDNNYFTRNFKWYDDESCLSIISSTVVITDSDFYYNRGIIVASWSNITIHRSTFSYSNVAIIVAGACNIVVDTCTGTNNYARPHRALIYAGSSSNVTIDRSTFHNNTARVILADRANINRSTFSYNEASENGGGAIGSGPLTVMNSVFHANRAYYTHGRYPIGGAITASEDLVVHNCSFTSNVATGGDITSMGGAIYFTGYRYRPTDTAFIRVSQSTFLNNAAITGDGGALYLTGSNIQLITSDCYFENNTASDYGGAVYSTGASSSVSVRGSTFVNNKALAESGGAIYSDSQNANITLISSTFNHSSASRCSVLDVDNFNHIVSMSDSIFESNTASGQVTGGGVACIRNATINITGSSFSHNFANFHGGVFYIDESEVRVDGSSFINNSATVDGGVFYTYVHASNYDIRRSQFSHNSVGDDGGVIFIGRELSQIFIAETTFDYNSAMDRGGVVSMINSSLEINSVIAFNNTARFGEVISACNSNVTFASNDLFRRTDPVYSFCTLFDGEIVSTTPTSTIATEIDPQSTSMADTSMESTPPTATTLNDVSSQSTESTAATTISDPASTTSLENAETNAPSTTHKEPMTTVSPTTDASTIAISTAKTAGFNSKDTTTQPTESLESMNTSSPTSQHSTSDKLSTVIVLESTTEYQPTTSRVVGGGGGGGNGDSDTSNGIGVVTISLIALLITISIAAILTVSFLVILFSYKLNKVKRQWIVTGGRTHGNPAYIPADSETDTTGVNSIHSYVDADAVADANSIHSYVDINAGAETNSIVSHGYVDADTNSIHSYVDVNAGAETNSIHTYVEVII